MAVIALFAFISLFFTNHVAAQTATVTAVCAYATWTVYRGLSPCQVWGNLQAACDPSASVGKLDTSVNPFATYPSPTGANATACQCNVVAYNLMAGCSWCQPYVYSSNWVSEAQWKSGCSNYDASGKLPSQANSLQSSIPPWALEVENGQSWLEFDASSIALAGSTPTGTVTAPTPFGTGGSFTTETGLGFGTSTAFGPFSTGPFSGGDDTITNPVINIGKVVGITVGVILGCYVVLYGIVLAVFVTRQKNRKAWYGPTAEFYRNGGRMGDLQAGQPLLSGTAQSFVNSSPGSTPYLTSPYQPTFPPPTQYDPNANYGQGYSSYPQSPTGQYDPSTNYGQPNPQFYAPNNAQTGTPHTGSTQQIIQV